MQDKSKLRAGYGSSSGNPRCDRVKGAYGHGVFKYGRTINDR